MIKLFEKKSNRELGKINETQLQFLIDHFEEEHPSDYDYYINQATLDFLKKDGADPELIEILKTALGDQEGMEFRWQRF